jgi:CrcB protein
MTGLLLVAIGGALGTAARISVAQLIDSPSGTWPLATFVVNLIGAFVLGGLVEALSRSGPDDGWRRRARLFAGTGFCGGLTTYSALAVEIDELGYADRVPLAAAYAVASAVLGVVAAGMGVVVAARMRSRGPGA